MERITISEAKRRLKDLQPVIAYYERGLYNVTKIDSEVHTSSGDRFPFADCVLYENQYHV